MRIDRVFIKHFRNIEDCEFFPAPDINIFLGENAQGKTNIAEAIWIMTGARSFRTSKDKEMIPFLKENFEIGCDFFAAEREQSLKLKFLQGRNYSINKVDNKKIVEVAGNFCAVSFSPAHLELVKKAPSERREFLDSAICQIKPSYITTIRRYKRALLQRNAMLKSENKDALSVFDEVVATLCAEINKARCSYLKKLETKAREILLSMGGEDLSLTYSNSECDKDGYLSLFKKALQSDFLYKTSSVGAHREDIEIKIGTKSAKSYASQGQQRSIVLALKLAEGEILAAEKGETPVYILDDVLSELDKKRREFILLKLKDCQVFITCCNLNDVRKVYRGKVFTVDNGQIKEKKR